MAERPEPAISDAMVEAKAIVLFYQDEFDNLAWIAAQDACGNPATGDKLGRDMDRWENHPEPVKDRFRNRARKALAGIAAAKPCLSIAEQKAQAARCGCRGADEYCPCQNVPDRETLKARMEAEGGDRG